MGPQRAGPSGFTEVAPRGGHYRPHELHGRSSRGPAWLGRCLMGTPSQGGGTIDVKPPTLHQVAGGFAGQQTPLDKGAKDLITALKEYPDAGGYGTAAQSFATEYVTVANR